MTEKKGEFRKYVGRGKTGYSYAAEAAGKPKGKVDVVLDTDTYNEIDDQFALAYLIKSNEKLNLQAVYAAPFFNHHQKVRRTAWKKAIRKY